MKRLALLALVAAGLAATAAPAYAAQLDFGKQTWNILPPGQSGAIPPDRHSTDQLRLYDRLTPLFDKVKTRDIRRNFKSARFFAPKGGPVVRPERTRACRPSAPATTTGVDSWRRAGIPRRSTRRAA